MPGCARRCMVEVTDVVTGRVITVRQQAGEVAVSATFSPDGSYLAIQVGADLVSTGTVRPEVVALEPGQGTAALVLG
jgi:hypothetical protein